MAYITFQPSDYFNTVLWTGNATANRNITGVGFQPDWVWVKNRSRSSNHTIVDVLRGSGSYPMSSSNTGAEDTSDANQVSALISDGFTVGSSTNTNANGENLVGWSWKAGGSGSSNSDGSITSTVSASTTSGVSIVTWTGNSGSIGHGLGQKPAMIISKSRGATGGWYITHKSLSAEMQDNYMFFDTSANSTNNDIWGGEPTTSTFSVGSGLIGNTTHVAYVFAEKKGFSKFGSYTGNGNADGPFIYTGFKPAFLLAKESSSSGEGWIMLDSVRNPSNLAKNSLQANINQAEETLTTKSADFLSNGFKIRTTDGLQNSSGETYIYMAFAEEPLVSSNNIPATAR